MTTPLKKAAESVMQGFVHDFARRADPSTYPHSRDGYKDFIRRHRNEAEDYIHGAAILMIAIGQAPPGGYNSYREQIDAITARYLEEFSKKPEKAA